MSDKPLTLRARFIAAQAEMNNAVLNKTNPHFRSSYADLGSVRDATLDALNKHGLGISHSFAVGDGFLLVTTEIFDDGDQTLSSQFPVMLEKPQQMGSGITYAKRYNWGALTAIATDEDDDGNEAQKTSALKTTTTKPKAESRDPYSTLQTGLRNCATRAELQEWAVVNKKALDELPDDWHRTIQSDYRRHLEGLEK